MKAISGRHESGHESKTIGHQKLIQDLGFPSHPFLPARETKRSKSKDLMIFRLDWSYNPYLASQLGECADQWLSHGEVWITYMLFEKFSSFVTGHTISCRQC